MDRMPSNDALKVVRAMVSSREEIGISGSSSAKYSSYGDLVRSVSPKATAGASILTGSSAMPPLSSTAPEGQDWAEWFERD